MSFGGGGGGSGNLSDSGDVTLSNPVTGEVLTYDAAAAKWENSASALNRANHTGTQAISTVSGLQTALDGKAALSHTHAATDVTSGTFDYSRLPAGTTLTVQKSGGTWPARPTARTDITVQWKGPDPSPSIVSSGTGGMLDNVDIRLVTP